VGLKTAYTDVQAVLAELRVETKGHAEEVLALELERCDVLTKALAPAAEAGDVASILATVRVMDRRAKYLGLDAPAKVEQQTTIIDHAAVRTSLNDRIAALAERLAAGAARESEPRADVRPAPPVGLLGPATEAITVQTPDVDALPRKPWRSEETRLEDERAANAVLQDVQAGALAWKLR